MPSMEQTRNYLIFCWRAVVCSLASAGRRRRVHYLYETFLTH